MNDLLRKFEDLGWKFEIYNEIVYFRSPRSSIDTMLCTEKDIESLDDEKILNREIEVIMFDWENKILDQFDRKVLKNLSNQYRQLLKMGFDPPETNTVSFDVKFPKLKK